MKSNFINKIRNLIGTESLGNSGNYGFARKFSLLLQLFLNKPFIKDLSIITGGTLVAQVINALSSPILTRLFSVEAFGTLGVFESIVEIIKPIAHLSYGFSIILPPEDDDSIRLIQITVFIGFVVSLVTFITIFFFRQQILIALRLNINDIFLFFIPSILFFTIIEKAYGHWLIRKKIFKISAFLTVAASLFTNFGKIGLGFFAPGSE